MTRHVLRGIPVRYITEYAGTQRRLLLYCSLKSLAVQYSYSIARVVIAWLGHITYLGHLIFGLPLPLLHFL